MAVYKVDDKGILTIVSERNAGLIGVVDRLRVFLRVLFFLSIILSGVLYFIYFFELSSTDPVIEHISAKIQFERFDLIEIAKDKGTEMYQRIGELLTAMHIVIFESIWTDLKSILGAVGKSIEQMVRGIGCVWNSIMEQIPFWVKAFEDGIQNLIKLFEHVIS